MHRRVLVAVTGTAALAILMVAMSRLPGRISAPKTPEARDTHGIRFEEIAEQSGVRFRWNEHPRRPLTILDGFGCGCAFLDYDRDGQQDVFLVNEPTCGLFRNTGGGRFQDVTRQVGLEGVRGAWKGVAIGDYDGDGWLDLFLTGYHRLALLRSRQGARFTDTTRAAGLDPDNWRNWGASAGFMDLDGDGDLDLLMQNYVVFGPGVKAYCTFKGLRMACPPEVHDPERGRLFRNNGEGTFSDVSRTAGLGTTTGAGMVVGFADTNADGLMDFYLGNDGRDADFMQNLGGLRFRNVALQNGTAMSAAGTRLAAMGVDWADYDRDGKLDFAVSAFSEDSSVLFHQEEGGSFRDVNRTVGIGMPTYLSLGFGTKFADADNDGWPDLFFVNGHIIDRIEEATPGLHFRDRSMLFHNDHGRRFTDLAPALGGALMMPILGRGSASGDIDNDGRIDLLAVDYEGRPLLLRNRSETPHHWLTLDLRGRGKNHFAYGAQVTVKSGLEVWVGQVSPTSSYLSSSDPRVHFGLGSTRTADQLAIRWPSGRRTELRSVPVDRVLTLNEPVEETARQRSD